MPSSTLAPLDTRKKLALEGLSPASSLVRLSGLLEDFPSEISATELKALRRTKGGFHPPQSY